MQNSKKVTEPTTTPPKVSIVLPAYNEGSKICGALMELERQTFKNREVLIINDGSTDDTFNRASTCSKEYDDAIVIQSNHGGPSHARNAGIHESKGEIVFFGECDCVYDYDYLEKAVKALQDDPAAGAVCLTGAPLILKHTLGTACIGIENIVQHRLLKEGNIKPFYAWVYRREVLRSVGGFDETLFQAEDKDLFQRVSGAGYRVALVPGINWRHKREESMGKLAREWFSRGKTRILYIIKYRQSLDLLKNLTPLWLFILGMIVFIPSALIGSAMIVLSLGIPMLYSLRMIILSWKEVGSKIIYLWYPVFVLIRNFGMAMGYSYGLLRVLVRKIQGRPVTWQTI